MATRIPAGKVALHVREEGSGTPVLLVHAFPLNHEMWNDQFDALASKYRLIAPDLRGFGHSQVIEGTATMKEMADDLAALLDSLNVSQPVTLCGLSMGGYVIWEFLRAYRQRVRSLILCDTRATADTGSVAEQRLELASEVLAAGSELLVERLGPKLISSATREKRPEVVERVNEMIRSAPPQGVAAALRGMAERRDSSDLLEQIDVPTLLVVGRDDELTPPDEMRSMADSIATARFEIIDEAGHLPAMEQSDAFNALLADFLPLQ